MNKYFITLLISLVFFCAEGQIVKAKYDSDTRLYGFVDNNSKWIVKPSFVYAYWHSEGNYGEVTIQDEKLAEKNNRVALIDDKGKRFTDFIYSGSFCVWPNEPIIVEKRTLTGVKKGVIDRKGKLLLAISNDEIYIWNPSRYSTLSDGPYFPYFTEAICTVNQREDVMVENLYNWKGKKILDKEYNQIIEWTIKNPTYRVQFGDKYGLFSTSGKLLLECIYDDIKYSDKFPIVALNSKMGLFNPMTRKFIIPLKYEEILPSGLDDDIFIVKENGLYGLYGENRLLIPCKYSEFSTFENDVAVVVSEGTVELLRNPLVPTTDIQLTDIQPEKKVGASRAISRYPSPNSDVDKNIPKVTNREAANKFAFIIANENYPDAPVPFALNDGRIFAEYCNKSLNIPLSNIYVTEDATYANLIAAIDKIKNLSEVFEDDASIIFYYAGHGVPSEQENSAYLFPIDGNINNIKSTSYSMESLYAELAKLSFKESIVFIDACFSGTNRDNETIIPGRGISIKVKEEKPIGNVIAFSASQGNETAHQLTDKTHGMFTYFILKAIQENKGDISLGELTDYVIKNVRRQSVVINSKKQTPTVLPSNNILENWREIRL